MTPGEHMAWAKERALALVEEGDLVGALASLSSDFLKHPELRDNPTLGMLIWGRGAQCVDDAREMRRFIEGFAG